MSNITPKNTISGNPVTSKIKANPPQALGLLTFQKEVEEGSINSGTMLNYGGDNDLSS